jgi:hypothetical protein
MKRVSMIAAGLLALGVTAARAETGNGGTTVEVTPPPASKVDVNVNPSPKSDVDVNVNPNPTATTPSDVDVNVNTKPSATTNPPENKAVSPATEVPGATETPPANVNVDVNPTPPVQSGPTPMQPGVRPPARIIDANTAAINGGTTESVVPVGPGPFYPARPRDVVPLEHTWVSRVGAGILVGGGFEDFTSNTMRNMTGTGGMWNARLLAGTRQFVGLEAAYVGNARSIDALGLQSNALLVSNGVEGAARVNVPVVMQHAQLLEPFGFVGLGWSHYQVTNSSVNTSDVARDDDIMALPVGGGLEYAIGRFMADARFTYRATYYNDLMRNGGNLNSWGVGTQIGFSF